MIETRLIEVYRAKDSIHAHLLKARLEEAGIEARVQGDHFQGALGAAPFGWFSLPQILVRESDAERTRDILAALEQDANRTATAPPSRWRALVKSCLVLVCGGPVG